MTTSSSEWQLKIKALFDSSELTRGTNTAEDSVKSLETQVERSTDSINADLRAMDDGVSSSLGPSGTFTRNMDEGGIGVGKLKDSVEEIPGAMQDMAESAAGAASGLANAFATLGPGGLALGTVLSGFAILKTKADETAQLMRDRVNAALDAIEVKAKQSNAAILKSYNDTLTFQKTVSDIGGGDENKGFGILAEHAKNLGVSVSDIVSLINHDFSPGALALRTRLREARDAVAEQNRQLQDGTRFVHTLSSDYGFIQGQLEQANRTRQETLRQLRQERDYARETAEAHKAGAGWLSAQEARIRGINNKLSAQQKYYGGLPQ